MSEFNGKKFYGFSLHDDPALTTTTRNFEFKYTRPEQLERAIQKVQLTDNNTEKQKKCVMLNKYCKLKKSTPSGEVSTAFKTRDIDIETHVSRDEVNKVRALSEVEVDQLIGKAKSMGELTGARERCNVTAPAATNPTTHHVCACTHFKDVAIGTGCGYTETAMQYPDPADDKESQVELEDAEDDSKTEIPLEEVITEEYREPQPKWVEIIATPQAVTGVANEIKTCSEVQLKKYSQLPQQALPLQALPLQAHAPSSMPPSLMGNLFTPVSHNIQLVSTMPYEVNNQAAYFVEDSDLEYEMMGRADYTKFCGIRQKEEDALNVSNDNSGGYPEFIEMEPEIPLMDLSFLKNTSPMRYSDMTDDIVDEANAENPQMKIYITKNKQKEHESAEMKGEPKENERAEQKVNKEKKKKRSPVKSNKSTPRNAYSDKEHVISPRSKYIENTPRPSAQRSPPPRRLKRYAAHSSKASSTGHTTDRTHKHLTITKSLEELKMEKLTIFTKMTHTQERIIELLDKLRMSLLELYVPENNFDKHKRQKNAFEFTVRFSRNFLYPLKGMIEDLKVTSVEQLNSASSNDACTRVGVIYGLIYQSLQTYSKQLHYFLLDQIPQKLTTLIEMIYTTTAICLEKGLFDRNDAIIDCVQDRCTKFLGFLEDMYEERFVTARENYRKSNPKSHTKYNLKMFMNDLNMYEPKLVPKVTHHSRRRIQQQLQRKVVKTKQSSNNNNITSLKTSDMGVTKATDDAISTQMQATTTIQSPTVKSNNLDTQTNSRQSILTSSNELLTECNLDLQGSNTNPLNRIILEALKTVTKEQVRQVLEPIIQSLGTALDKKDIFSKTMQAIQWHNIPGPISKF